MSGKLFNQSKEKIKGHNKDLIHLEAVHDVFDIYLWLSYRFQDMFPDVEIVRSVQTELDHVIEDGVANIVQLLKNADSGVTSGAARVPVEDAFEAKNRKLMNHKRWQHDNKNLRTKKNAAKGDNDQPPGINEIISPVTTELSEELKATLKVLLYNQYSITRYRSSNTSEIKQSFIKMSLFVLIGFYV